MKEQKIGALIPIRLASERLPGKAVREICGKPIVCHLLDRAFASRYLAGENVVVCTTREPSDDPLVEVVKGYGAGVFRGSTDDIIERFYRAMEEHGFTHAVQIDGDDITAEPLYMDLTMEKLLSDETLDIATCRDLPLGTASKSFSMEAMEKVYRRYKTIENDTGFIYFFTKTDFCKSAVIDPLKPEHRYERVRLTLDYEEDLEFFRTIFGELYKEGEVFHLDDILELIRAKPELVEINFFREEEFWERTRAKTNLSYLGESGGLETIQL